MGRQGPSVHKPRAGSCSLPLHTDGLEPLGPELLLPALLGPCLTPGTMKQQVFWTGLEYTCPVLQAERISVYLKQRKAGGVI